MFWGISLEVGKRYSQTVEKSFHISMAALTSGNEKKSSVTVMVEVEKACYPICTLQPGKIPQQALDYIFTEGEEVLFYTEGDIDVHLTGYLIDEPSPFEHSTDDEESASESNAASSGDEKGHKKKKSKNSENDSNEGDTLGSLISELDGLNEDNENNVNIWLERSVRKKQKCEDESTAPVSSLTEKLLNDGDSDESEDGDWIPGGKRKLKKKEKAKGTSGMKEKEKKQDVENGSKKEESDSNMSPSKLLNSSKSKQKNSKKSNGDLEKSESSNANVGQDRKSNTEKSNKMEESDSVEVASRTELSGGLIVEDLVKGGGKKAKKGRQVSMYYKGCLKNSKKEFDSCLKGKPFTFKLGQGEVIKGWDNGIEGMQVGGKRRLTVPPALGYGSQQVDASIPPNSTLVFVVELLKVH